MTELAGASNSEDVYFPRQSRQWRISVIMLATGIGIAAWDRADSTGCAAAAGPILGIRAPSGPRPTARFRIGRAAISGYHRKTRWKEVRPKTTVTSEGEAGGYLGNPG